MNPIPTARAESRGRRCVYQRVKLDEEQSGGSEEGGWYCRGFQLERLSTGPTMIVNSAASASMTSSVFLTLFGAVHRVSVAGVPVCSESLEGVRLLHPDFLPSLFYRGVSGSAVCCLRQTVWGSLGPRQLVTGHCLVSLPSEHRVLQG